VTGDQLQIYDASAGSTDKDRRVDVNKFGRYAAAGTWTAAQTYSVATKVPAGINAETFALDSSGGAFSLSNNQSLPISVGGFFAGLVIIINATTGSYGLYMCSGNTVTAISAPSGAWGVTSGAQANNLFYASSKYWVENHTGATCTYYLMALRVRDAA
jgi:hypothetical protein